MLTTLKRTVANWVGLTPRPLTEDFEPAGPMPPALGWATRTDCARLKVSDSIAGWSSAWMRNQLTGLGRLSSRVLLDVGSDAGSILSHWCGEHGRHCYHIVADPGSAGPAPGTTAIVHQMCRPLPLPNASVDVVFSARSIQFMSLPLRRHLFAEAARVLRPGGFAIWCMAHVWPLSDEAHTVLQDEPLFVRHSIRGVAALDLPDLLAGTSLRIDGSIDLNQLPGGRDFRLEPFLARGDVLAEDLTGSAPTYYSQPCIDLKLQRIVLGLRLQKPAPAVALTSRPSEQRLSKDDLRAFLNRHTSFGGTKILLVNDDGGEVGQELSRLGAQVQSVVDSPERLRAVQAAAPDRPCRLLDLERPDFAPKTWFNSVVLLTPLQALANPGAFLAQFGKIAAEMWLHGTLVHTPCYECSLIPPDDLIECEPIRGQQRISRAWLWRKLMAHDHLATLVAPPEPPTAFWASGEMQRLLIRTNSIYGCRPDAFPPLLVHVHIPKNAGSSFNDFLVRSFGLRFVPLYYNNPRQQIEESDLCQAAQANPHAGVISSHSFASFPPIVAGRRALYVTFLRRPLQRHLSYFRYARKHGSGFSEQHVEALPEGFDAMTPTQYLQSQAKLAEDGMFTHSQCAMLNHGVDDAHAAQRILESFFFVGLVENMDRSVAKLRAKCRAAGIKLGKWKSDRVNTTSELYGRHADVPDELVNSPAIRRLLAEDEKLHDWASRRMG